MEELCNLLWITHSIRGGSCQIGLTLSFCPPNRNPESEGASSSPLCTLLLSSCLPPKPCALMCHVPTPKFLFHFLSCTGQFTSKTRLYKERFKSKCYTEAVGENLLEEGKFRVDFGQSGRIWIGGGDGKVEPARGNGWTNLTSNWEVVRVMMRVSVGAEVERGSLCPAHERASFFSLNHMQTEIWEIDVNSKNFMYLLHVRKCCHCTWLRCREAKPL